MFFNSRKNTDINYETEQKNSLLCILEFVNKYKIFLMLLVLLLIIVVVIVLFLTKKDNNYLYLLGDDTITLYVDSDYVEPGYNAYSDVSENLNNKVEITSNLDTSKVGEYEIRYSIGDVVVTRKIFVIEKPKEYTYIYLKTVKNSVNVYLKLGEEYVEPGYQVFSSTGKDLTDDVVVSGKVDTTKRGSYTLIYSVVDSNNVTVSVLRTVIVMDTEISLSLSSQNYTNNDVTIDVRVLDDYFDYMVLPDNTKVMSLTYLYKVSENGKYTFKTYNSMGIVKQASIEVKNINRTLPSGSCNGSYEGGVSRINVIANDDIGIEKYEINGKVYKNGTITVNQELSKVTVRIYDKAGNEKDISCNLEDKNKLVLFGKNITLSYEYFSEGSLPYGFYTPTVDNKDKKIPLIVWLHGSAEVSGGEVALKNSTFLSLLNKWNMEGFNAYVLCPQLRGGKWADTNVKTNLYALIDKIVKDNNIDTNKIVIAGHSLGAIGAQYMTYYKQNYFSAMVVLSGYHPFVDIAQIRNIAVKGYVGSLSYGEQTSSYSYMKGTFSNVFGGSKVSVLDTSHSGVVKTAFTIDSNNDNRSDLIEWMLNQELK